MAPARIAGWGIVAFLIGVIIAGRGANLTTIVFLSIALSGTAFYAFNRRPIFLFVAFSFIFGIIYYHAFFAWQNAGIILPAKNDEFIGVVISGPKSFGDKIQFKTELAAPFHGELVVISEETLGIGYGSEVRGKGTTVQGDHKHDGIRMYASSIVITDSDRGSWLIEMLYRLKERSLHSVSMMLKGDEGAFLSGILLGQRNELSESLKADLKNSGTTHLIALSGYNISIIVFALSWLLFGLVTRRHNFLITSILIWMFTLMVGAEASIVRASLMGVAFLGAKEIGRIPSFDLIMIWSGFVMVLWNPAVIFSLGFILSFASMIGIGYIAPALSWLLKLVVRPNSFKELVILTISAQLGTAPIILSYFEELALSSIFANILILPVMPFLMLGGFIAIGLGFFGSAMVQTIILLINIPLAYVLKIIHIFGDADSTFVLGAGLDYFIYIYIALISILLISHARRTI